MSNLTKTQRNDPFFGLVNEMFFPITRYNRWSDSPKMNIIDGENSYEIHVQAPGQKKENFDISVDDGSITITSNFEESNEDSQRNWTRREFYRSHFMRSFRLPENVNTDEISAKYEDGILEVVVPKLKKEPKKRSIQIS